MGMFARQTPEAEIVDARRQHVWWDVEWRGTSLWGTGLDEATLICLVKCGIKRHITWGTGLAEATLIYLVRCGMKRHIALRDRAGQSHTDMSGEMWNEETHHSEEQGWMRPHWYVWWDVSWRDTSLWGTRLDEATLICLVRCGMKRHSTLRDMARWSHTDMSGEMWNEEIHHSEGKGWMRPHRYVWWDVEWRDTSLEGQGWLRPHWYIWWDVEWRDTSLWGIWLDEVRLICLVRCGMKRYITLRDTARWNRTDMSGERWNEETHHLRDRVVWGHTDISGEMWNEATHRCSAGQGWPKPHWYVWWDAEWRDTSLWGTGLDEATLIYLVRCGMKRHIALRDRAGWSHTDMSGEMWNEETHHSEGQGWMRPHWYVWLDVEWRNTSLWETRLDGVTLICLESCAMKRTITLMDRAGWGHTDISRSVM